MLSVDEFIKIFNESTGPRDIEAKTGMNKAAILARARRYRNAGIYLKRFRLPINQQKNHSPKRPPDVLRPEL